MIAPREHKYTRKEVEEGVIGLIRDLDSVPQSKLPQSIGTMSKLHEIGVDSLSATELAMRLQTEYSLVNLEGRAFEGRDVNGVINYITSQLGDRYHGER